MRESERDERKWKRQIEIERNSSERWLPTRAPLLNHFVFVSRKEKSTHQMDISHSLLGKWVELTH